MAFGPEAGLALVDGLSAEPALRGYHLLPSVRGDLLARLGRCDEARAEFERAASLTQQRAASGRSCPSGPLAARSPAGDSLVSRRHSRVRCA